MEPISLRISLITKPNLAKDFRQKYMHLSEKQLIQEIYIMHLCNNKQVSMLPNVLTVIVYFFIMNGSSNQLFHLNTLITIGTLKYKFKYC